MKDHAELPRTVKPRKHKPRSYGIVAICRDQTLDETGSLGTVDDLVRRLPDMSPTIFVRRSIADWVAELDTRFEGNAKWQWRASAHEREITSPSGKRPAIRVSTVIHYFGFRGSFHLALDPVTFYGKDLDDIWPGDTPLLNRLYEWAFNLREWCNANNLLLRPTNGALASQLLRDPRFYPVARRKVPAATNNSVRTQLPGNHYRLFATASPQREYTAIYIDQRRAHHYHARTTALPDSNTLYAFGRFVDLAHPVFPVTRPRFHGLYCLLLRSPPRTETFAPYFPKQKGCRVYKAFVYSNELPTLQDLGYTVEGVIAAWGSHEKDTGIPKLAAWAESELDRTQDAPWLKPILLASYGVLAMKPRPREYLYKRAKRGEPAQLLTGHNALHGLLVAATNGRKLEPNITNVLHRGMIEAATRIESLGLAHWLTHQTKHRILSIYADAVIVEADDDKPLPPLPEPWRIKTTLNHLQFINTQAFMSGEMTKLPGVVGREIRGYSRGIHGRAPYRTFNLDNQSFHINGRKI